MKVGPGPSRLRAQVGTSPDGPGLLDDRSGGTGAGGRGAVSRMSLGLFPRYSLNALRVELIDEIFSSRLQISSMTSSVTSSRSGLFRLLTSTLGPSTSARTQRRHSNVASLAPRHSGQVTVMLKSVHVLQFLRGRGDDQANNMLTRVNMCPLAQQDACAVM